MNQATRRKIRHFLHFLITLVVIFIQITLPLGALVTAIQPTPQMAQQTAQQVGLGDWLAARAGDLIAWAQPLWGEPKTAAAQSDAPGGVSASGLYWFKADNPAATTTTWPDAFANGYNTTAATAVTLNTSTNLANFNPTYTFNGTNNRFTTTAITYSPNSTNGDEVFAVTYVTNSSATDHEVAHFGKQATSTTQWEFDIWQGNIEFGAGDPYGAAVSSANIPNTSWSILNANRQGTGAIASVYQENLNGLTVPFGTNQGPNANYIGGFDQFTIGARRYNGNFDTWYQGQLAEVIGYSRKLSTTERQQVSSYLALKYGITQGSTASPVNYLNSVGATIWTGSATYQNHVFGIGKDAGSALEQQIAAAQYPTGDIITIATDNNFTGANGSHTAIANDQFFFLVGNNGGSTSYTAKTGLSNGLNAILNRVWKVEQTGTAQDLYLKTSNSQATYLLYSTDATFSTGVTYAALTSGATAGLQIPNGNYFTFATTTAPPVLQSLTSTTADGAYTNGDQIAICANYDQELAAGSTLNVTLDTGATLTLTHVDASLGGTISVDGSYAIGTGANNVVYALALQSDEKAVIGGQFTTYNGTTRTRIARINSDGTLDTSFDPGTGLNNYPEAILMQPDGKILIAGNFTTVNGTSRTYLARLNSDGSLDTSFNTTLNNVVYAMDLQADGKIVIGGQFSTVNGTGRTRIARVNSDGTLDPSFTPGTGLNNYPEALLVRPDGKVLMAGNFTTVNGTSRAYLGLLNSDGTLDTSFTPTLNNVVYAMTRQSDGKLVISGAFNTVNSTGRTRLARLNADGTLDSGFDPGTGLNNYAESIIVQSDNKLLLGGNFTTVNGTSRAYLARVNADGAVDTTFAPGTGANNVVYALGLQSDGKVVSGGAFTSFNGTSQNRLTRLNGDANNAASADQQACGAYTVLPGHNSNDLTVSAITSANVIATTGDTSTATTIPSGENLADNAALVIASSAPGGVTTNLAWWFQGNRGVQTSGTAVTQWNDSNVALNVSQATAANQPTTSKSQNFNPIVTFDGSNDYLSNSAGYWKATTSNNQYDTFVVSTNQNSGGVNAVFGESTSAGTQMMFLPYSGNAYNGFWNSYTSSNNQIGTTGTPYLWSGRFNNSSTPKVNAISQNGKQLASSTSTAAFNGSSSALYLGAHQPNNWYYNGDVAEVVLYATDLSATQRQQVLSYLALKWGLTLDQSTATDYLASDGTTQMWSSSANSGYANNIAGIGRDLNAGLNQKQSQSVNSGTQVVIGLGAIAASNAANANSFAADKSFLTWGDNGQATTFGVSYSPTSFTPVAGYYRMSRVWKVQESGTITDVVVFTGKGEHLLVSNDPTFATGVTEIALTSGSATVDLSNGQYFTFGNTLYAPGGVATNLNRWYKADAGVTTATGVAQWADQSQNEVSVTQGTTADQPVYNTTSNLLNFNPSLTFDGSNDRLNNTSGGVAFGTGGYTAYYVASNTTPSASKYVLGFGVAGNLNGFNSGSAATATSKTSGGTTFATETNVWTAAIANLTRTGFNGGATQPYYLASNGGAEATSSNVSPNVTDLNLAIGARPDGAANFWQGNIAEVILYSGKQSATDYNKVESYLALKYGITKAGDYVDTATTTIWDAAANSGYANNIAGMGRDDAEALNQKQSQSVNSGFQPLIGLGGLAATNTGNSNTFAADKSYLLWGDDNAGTQFTTALSGPVGVPVNNRMTRIWKVQNTGNVGQVKFAAPTWLSLGNTVYLVVSSDATFDNTDTFLPLTPLTVGSTTYLATDVTLSNGQYFSLATFTTAPGGVNNNLGWWFQGNVGVQESGGSVYQWNDSSNSTLNVSQATSANQPTYAKYQNYNPIVTFDGATNDYLSNSAGYWKATTGNNQYNTFVVSTNQDTSGVNAVFGESTNSGPQTMFLPYNGNVENALWSGYRATSNQIGTTGTSYLWSGRFNNSSTPKLNAISQNGKQLASSTSTTAFNGSSSALYIGAYQPSGWYYRGDIAEVAMYATDLSATQQQQVLSYLALKWGLTLDQSAPTNYLASDGSTIWNATTAGSYNQNIAGIGLDLSSGLNQKQSRSNNTSNSGNLVAMSIGAFANTNLQNSGAFAADRSFEIWSDNGGSTTFVTLVPGVSNPQLARMSRIWQVQETAPSGFPVGTVRVRVSQSAFDGPSPTLIRSTDATFDSSDTFVAMTDDGAGNYQAQIDFSTGDYFTLANDPIKETFGKTGTSSGVPLGGVGTITTTWQITYNNVTGRLLPNVVLTDTWSAGQTLVPASVQTPGGDWTWTVVNSTTLKFSNPLVVPNGQGIGKSLTIPMPAGVNLGGGGDGYNPAIVLNTGRAYGINHHNNPANLWCFDPVTAGFCTGYPKSSGVQTGNDPFALAVQDKIYFNTDGTSYGGTSGGIYCMDSTTDVFGGCGSNASAEGLGLVYVNAKLYYLKDSESGGGIGCVDPSNSLANCAGYTSLSLGVTPGATNGAGGDIFAVGNKIYVSDSNNKLNCYDAVTATYCTGWSATPKTLTAGRWNIFPRLSSLGVITGICTAGNGTDATCTNLDGSSPTTAATASVHRTNPGITAIADTYIGSRVFFATYGTASGLVCWDWALNSGNGGACTGAYFNANGETTAGSNASYGVTNDGSNVYSYGDSAVLQSWNPLTGQNPSVNSVATINVDMDSFYSCIASSPADLAWYRVQIYDTNLDPSTDFDYLNVTVTDPTTGAVLFGPVDAVGTSGVFDISSIPSTYRTLKLVVSGKAANNNAAWADGVGPKASLTYISNTAPQFCFQMTVSADCNINPNLTVSNQLESALTIGSISNATVNVCAIPNLVVAKSGPSSAVQGIDFDYTLVITNTGGLASSGVITVTDTLTTGLSFVSGSGGGFTCSAVGQAVTCTSSSVIAANNGTASITLTVNPTALGAVSNTASIIGGGDTSAATSNTVNTTVYAAPVISQPTTNPAAVTIPENTTAITDVNTTDDIDSEGSGLTYGLSGADASAMTIDATGNLSFLSAPDYETPSSAASSNTYTVTVTVTDTDNLTDSVTIVVTVSDVADTPVLVISKSGPVTATQGTDFSYTLVVTNTGGGATSGVITVTDTLAAGLSFVSGSGSGFTCSAVGQLVTCTSSGVIAAGNGTATMTLTVNPTAPGAVSNTASVVGGGDTSAATSNTVNTMVKAAPGISQPANNPAALTIPENTTALVDVNTTDDIDSEGSGLTYGLSGADASAMTIDATGNLSFLTAPDYETPNSAASSNTYTVTVTVTDTDNLTDSVTIVVTVSDVADTPDLTVTIGQPQPALVAGVASNVPVTVTNVGDTPATDPLTTTVTLPAGVTAPASFTDNGWNCTTTGQTVSCVNAGPLNAGANSSFNVPVTADNSTIGTQPGPFTATTDPVTGEVNAANNGPASMTPTTPVAAAAVAPTITSGGSVSIPENTTVVTTVVASGTAPITYSIVGGADAALFTIDLNTGALSFVTAPDFENPTDSGGDNVYNVTVRASNSAGTDDQAIAVIVLNDPNDTIVTLPLKVFLQGPYVKTAGLMTDTLRSLNLLPTTSPYTATATTNAGVLAVSGSNAIVDWVLVEVRNATTPTTVVASQAALLQRDGDVVGVDGTSVLTFTLAADNYYVVVNHRNHLGAMSAAPVALSAATGLVNFTTSAGYGTHGQAAVGSVYALWMGDTNGDNQVIGAGPSNDRNAILSEVLAAPGNTNHNANYIVTGYSTGDVNLDGRVIVAGPGNDINYILYNVFVHPGNGSAAANFVVQGQVP